MIQIIVINWMLLLSINVTNIFLNTTLFLKRKKIRVIKRRLKSYNIVPLVEKD